MFIERFGISGGARGGFKLEAFETEAVRRKQGK